MLELLRDPAWQFVGAILTLVALAATFLIYWLQRQRKSLSYEVVSQNQLLTVREELEGRLQVLYEGEPARDICLLVIKLLNSGNVAVSAADYERPVSFATGASSKILSAAVTDVDPENLAVDISVDDSRVTVQPVLLNAKDSITLKLLVSDFSGSLSVDGRVVGVKTISNVGQTSGYQALLMFVALVCFAVGLYLVTTYTPKPDVRPPTPLEVKVGIGLLGGAYIAMVLLMLKSRQFRNVLRRILLRARG